MIFEISRKSCKLHWTRVKFTRTLCNSLPNAGLRNLALSVNRPKQRGRLHHRWTVTVFRCGIENGALSSDEFVNIFFHVDKTEAGCDANRFWAGAFDHGVEGWRGHAPNVDAIKYRSRSPTKRGARGAPLKGKALWHRGRWTSDNEWLSAGETCSPMNII